MAVKNILEKYVYRKNVSFSLNLENKAVDYELQMFIVDPKKKSLLSDFNDYLEVFLNENEFIGTQFYLMTMFYLKYKNPLSSSTKQFYSYKRDRRKFDIRTLADKKYLTFFENKKLSQTYNVSDKLKQLQNSQAKTDKRKLSQDLLNDSLYYNPEYLTMSLPEEYYEFVVKLMDEFLDYEVAQSSSNSENRFNTFKNIFYKYDEDESTRKYITRFLYECEGVHDYLWEEFFREILNELVKITKLSEAEINLYKFIYFRNEYFDYHIPIFEHVLVQFWNHININWKTASLWSLIEPEESKEKRTIIQFLKGELEKFLKTYKVWLAIVQQDELLEYWDRELLQEPDQKNKEKIPVINSSSWGEEKPDNNINQIMESLSKPIESGEGGFELVDIIPGDNKNKEFFDDLSEIIEKYLSDKQKEVLMLHFFDDLTQNEIAENLGISQSAVSQRLESAKRIIKVRIK